ncbi:hypothetical protein CANCADRAFT_322 [Tortispora caseinolytica NRRL Y-17796]|uniref:tRNA (guanine(10)-N(2))-methyltransferase n=1 Tax=Tortispora caseinolytica NRRL Y-17796 TaxID=767744 RepID=A0A1E4TJ19_9ASCO|nr:hypothetical protein CANCADRAFT_322 [Tortispora caseinolytica NRRL Y-17796]
MKKYLVLLAQAHETFREAELQALASLYDIDLDLSSYSKNNPFLVVSLEDDEQAKNLVSRAILVRSVFELWSEGKDLAELHENTKRDSKDKWELYKYCSFRFMVTSFQGSRPKQDQRELIESFSYLDFQGPIRMKDPDQVFCVLEDYDLINGSKESVLKHMCFGRWIADSDRHAIDTYDLKRRDYIGTTSFEAELALVTCNIAKITHGDLVYDPFAGTGSFLIAAAHYGGHVFGADIDGRQLRGIGKKSNIDSNFIQYNLTSKYIDVFSSDFTHPPFRSTVQFNAIVCDPPYGVREGLKVLGEENQQRIESSISKLDKDGKPLYLKSTYIPPKKNYDFPSLFDDILDFASVHLVPGGRLCCWVPVSNSEVSSDIFPQHPALHLISVCVQEFNKWSRVLTIYERRASVESTQSTRQSMRVGHFRNQYFSGFKDD